MAAILTSRNQLTSSRESQCCYFFFTAFFAVFFAAFLGAAFLPALFFTAFFAEAEGAVVTLATFFVVFPPKIPSQPEEYFSLVPTRVIVTESPFEN